MRRRSVCNIVWSASNKMNLTSSFGMIWIISPYGILFLFAALPVSIECNIPRILRSSARRYFSSLNSVAYYCVEDGVMISRYFILLMNVFLNSRRYRVALYIQCVILIAVHRVIFNIVVYYVTSLHVQEHERVHFLHC